jgi:hypothetical protein
MITDGTVLLKIRIFFIIHPHIHPAVQFSVFPDRTDLDATPARGKKPLVQFFRPGGTGNLVSKFPGVTTGFYSGYRADFDTPLAPRAERFFQHPVGREFSSGQYRGKPDPGAVLRGEKHIVETEIPKAGTICCMPVREKCNRFFLEDPN